MSNEESQTKGGPWTRHGHAVSGVTIEGIRRPPVARCGGPAICAICARDAERIRERAEARVALEGGEER